MSELIKPDKRYEQREHAQYLLMNTNSDFCQSDVEEAESLMEEVGALDPNLLQAIPGYIPKMEELVAKIEAYHIMDAFWQEFLDTEKVDLASLDAITAVKTSCEKETLAKYSYMTAYYHFCGGDIAKSKDIFENRTLKLAEKTSLRIADVEGLPEEVAKMKSLYIDMAQLDDAWKTYVNTGVSPGFDKELPLFPCNPIPNMKELVLKGVLDLCSAGPQAVERIKELKAQSGVSPDRELEDKVKALEASLAENQGRLSALNVAWEAFIPDNQVKHMGKYGYEYCEKEPLIRAYIMDGFAYTCEIGDEMLDKIDSLQLADRTPLSQVTMTKINELSALSEQYVADGMQIERIWNNFVAQGDRLTQDFQSSDYYCDNIHQVKDWVMKGLASDNCEVAIQYLDQIETFQRTFEFNLYEELECRAQNLRIKVWECRHEALLKLAKIEAPDNPEARLLELMAEYRMEGRPEVCPLMRR